MFDPNDPQRLRVKQRFRRLGMDVVYEDNHVLVINKPAGLLSQGDASGDASVVDWVGEYRRLAEGKPGLGYVGVVHRLDRNVSGCLVIGKTSKATGRLARQFRERAEEVEKHYLAWVDRPIEQDEGRLEHMLRRARGVTREAADGDTDGKRAQLRYKVEARSKRASRVRIHLVTGLSHQIRAQFYLVGHPLVGDGKYKGPPGKRPGLHAVQLAFMHPSSGVKVQVSAPIPDDLRRMDDRLQLEPPLP